AHACRAKPGAACGSRQRRPRNRHRTSSGKTGRRLQRRLGMPVKRQHRMPFGAELIEGGVRFRLWAPSAKTVVLVLKTDTGDRALEMTPQPQGWFEIDTVS